MNIYKYAMRRYQKLLCKSSVTCIETLARKCPLPVYELTSCQVIKACVILS